MLETDEQKRRIADKCDIWHALIAFDRSITPRMLDILSRTRKLLNIGTNERLAQAEFMLDANIQSAESYADYKGTETFLLDLARSIRERNIELVKFPKWFIESHLFSHYERVIPNWKVIQPHTLIHVDFEGEDLDVYLPEASLYEDMCFAYNQALTSKELGEKAERKAHTFYVRAAIISAFNFVESYLNGLAFDFLATIRRTLPERERDLLAEWDSVRKRQKYVRFREKAVQYPRIILNRKTPPFTESSCVSLKVLIEHIGLRDAVVHSSPKVISNEIPKMRDLIEMKFNDSTEVVDAAVDFVKQTDELIYRGKYDNSWLFSRSKSGPFPPDSFN